MKWNGSIDLNGQDLVYPNLIQPIVEPRASAPTPKGAGQLYYDTGSQTLWLYTGSTWVEVGAGGGSGAGNWLGPQATDPGTATEGDVYYNTTTDELRKYTGSSWTNVNTDSGGSASIQKTIDSFIPDDTLLVSNVTLWSLVDAIRFPGEHDGACYFSFYTEPSWSFASNLQMRFDYSMNTSHAGMSIKLDLKYWVLANNDVPDPAAPLGTDSETFSSTATGNNYQAHASTLAVSSSHISSARQLVICKLIRDTSVANNHPGGFDLIKFVIHQ